MPLSDLHDGIHVGGHSEVMDDHDCLRPGSDPVLNILRVDAKGFRVDVGEDHGSTQGVDLEA